jgi:hypothetical protein
VVPSRAVLPVSQRAVRCYFARTRAAHRLTRLCDVLRGGGRDKHLRVVVLKGAGPAFCAGHDLYQIHDSQGDQKYFEVGAGPRYYLRRAYLWVVHLG